MSKISSSLPGSPIRAPGDPDHLMWVKPFQREVSFLLDGQVLAKSNAPLRVTELGRDIYDPLVYIPEADIVADLRENNKRTFCPLKGHTSYYDLVSAGGHVVAENLAWTYSEPLEDAKVLAGYVSFDTGVVSVTEAPI